MNRTRSLTSIAAFIAGALLLAGCTSAQVKPETDYSGEPKGVEASDSSAGGASWAVWLKGGEQFGIVLYGSSTCPPLVQSVKVVSSIKLEATLSPATGSVCTQDLVPHTTAFATPSGVDTSSDVTVTLPDTTLTMRALRG